MIDVGESDRVVTGEHRVRDRRQEECQCEV